MCEVNENGKRERSEVQTNVAVGSTEKDEKVEVASKLELCGKVVCSKRGSPSHWSGFEASTGREDVERIGR